MRLGRRSSIIAAVGFVLLALPAATATAASCSSQHWIGAWAASPSDASTADSNIEDFVDASGNPKPVLDDQTIRAMLTPTYGGSVVRLHLSNRFSSSAATLGGVTIAIKGAGAALSGPADTVSFFGQRAVTLASGQDVVSDPVNLRFSAMQTLAVSMYVSNSPGRPTEHYTARQTSYLTLPGSGDHSADPAGSQFTQTTTTRPYVDGLDVLAPQSAGAVVAFGDSITDGYQGPPTVFPETSSSLNANGRWPDDLARRLNAANIPLSVLNAGISGNMVLTNASTDAFGVPALARIGPDVLAQPGATTVIWLEGINDLPSGTTAASLEAGWTQGIDEMRAAGLHVLMGTLTPSGSASGVEATYGTAAVNAVREQANAWIRSQHLADGVIDFDAAVRDPSNPSQIDPAYDGGDGLHFNLAGYQAMANAIKLSLLRAPTCTTQPSDPQSRQRVVTPRRQTTRRARRRAAN